MLRPPFACRKRGQPLIAAAGVDFREFDHASPDPPAPLAFCPRARHIHAMKRRKSGIRPLCLCLALLPAAGALAACEPTVKLAAPDKPIVINLNVKIEREVRIKIEREVEDLLRDRKDLF